MDKRAVLIAVTITSFMTPFSLSSVNIALPVIARELSATTGEMNWIATSFLISSASFLIPAGRIADIYGRKMIYLAGIVVFSFGTLLSGLSTFPEMLISFRLIQGLGGAMIFSTGIAILTSVFEKGERGKILGINTAAVYTGLSFGPFAGGLMTELLGWRSIFILTFLIGLIALIIVFRNIQVEWKGAQGEKLDFFGSFLYALTVILFTAGTSEASVHYLILLSIVSFLLFIYYESRYRYPVLDLKLFKSNLTFTLSNLSALLNYSATFALTYLLSLYLQIVRGIDAGTAGTILVAQPLIMALLSPFSGWLSDRIEPRFIASAGMAINATGLYLLSMINETTNADLILAYLFIMGLGFALFSSPNTNAIMSSVDQKYYGIASATLSTMRVVGQTMSMAIVMLVFTHVIGNVSVNEVSHELLVDAMRASFSIFSILCLIGIITSIFRGNIR